MSQCSSSNALTFLARGNVALAVTRTVISALVTFLSVPLLVNLALDVFGGEAREIRLPVGPRSSIWRCSYCCR